MIKINGKDFGGNKFLESLGVPAKVGQVFEGLKAIVKTKQMKEVLTEQMGSVEGGLHIANLLTIDVEKLKKF